MSADHKYTGQIQAITSHGHQPNQLQMRDGGTIIALVTVMGRGNDRARRLAACWNACEGIPTHQLEVENGEPNNLGAMIDHLRTEREELLALLSWVTEYAEHTPRQLTGLHQWAEIARAALAKYQPTSAPAVSTT